MNYVAVPKQKLEDLDKWYEKQIQPFVYSVGILTLLGTDLELPIDVEKTKDGFRYAHAPHDRRLVDGAVLQILQTGGGALILRSFLKEKDKLTGNVCKEIRGWSLNPQGQNLFECIVRLPASQVKAAHTLDAQTGEILPLESGTRFR